MLYTNMNFKFAKATRYSSRTLFCKALIRVGQKKKILDTFLELIRVNFHAGHCNDSGEITNFVQFDSH